jgi:hypothetical protein
MGIFYMFFCTIFCYKRFQPDPNFKIERAGRGGRISVVAQAPNEGEWPGFSLQSSSSFLSSHLPSPASLGKPDFYTETEGKFLLMIYCPKTIFLSLKMALSPANSQLVSL